MMSVDVGKTHDSEGYGYREAHRMGMDFPQDPMWTKTSFLETLSEEGFMEF